MDFVNRRIAGHTDGLDAVAQAAQKMLRTERHAYLIYDGDYGVGLEKYIAKDFAYVTGDLQRAVTEALHCDDRVLDIEDFTMEKSRIDALEVSFLIVSSEGKRAARLEVAL